MSVKYSTSLVGGVYTSEPIEINSNKFVLSAKLKTDGTIKVSFVASPTSVFTECPDCEQHVATGYSMVIVNGVIDSYIKVFSASEFDELEIQWDGNYFIDKKS